MENNKYIIKKCTLIPNEGSSLDEDYDIVRGAPIINYYESIESPTISLSLQFLDVDQVISRKGIFGGEYIDLEVKISGFKDFKISSKKQKLMLNSVKNVMPMNGGGGEIATLEFVSMEAIINETARVNKKFTGNVSDIVEQLLKKDKKGIKSKKKLKKDRSANKYTFVGNLKRPFDTIQWLCPKSQASNKSFGFLFYETLDGYNFRSIEKLLEQDLVTEPVRYEKPDRPVEGDFRILKNNLNQANDIGMNLRMGMYANKTIYLDIENQTKQVVDFSVKDLKLKRPPKLLDGIEEYPSRLMLRVSDYGVSQRGSKKKDIQKANELAVYQNKSYIRNNLLFSQSLNISVPLNPDLRAGEMLELYFPLKKGDKDIKPVSSYGTNKDNDLSGLYLISELRHMIGGDNSETQLKLIRDLFSAS